tara:strand:- start:2181 stop:2402 length:222 start_codon:yes stop_codon:yes gene_type:complete
MRRSSKKKVNKSTKRKSAKRKSNKGPTSWNKHMMAVYKSMKAKNPSYKLQNAMKDARKTYKKGTSRPLSMSVD